MNKLKFLVAVSAICFLSLKVIAAPEPAPEVPDERLKLTEGASIKIPIISKVNHGEHVKFEKKLGKFTKFNTGKILKQIRKQLEDGKAPKTWIENNIDKVKDEILKQLKDKLTDLKNESKEAVQKALVDLQNAISNRGPKILISAQYSYFEDCKNPGDPGWSLTGSPLIEGGSGLTGEGKVGVVVSGSASVSAATFVGFSVNIAFSLTVEFGVSASFSATGATTPSPGNKPTAKVSALPRVTLTGGGKIIVQAGFATFGLGGTATDKHTFKRVAGTIVAGQDK